MTYTLKYDVVGRFRRVRGRDEDVFLADGPDGQEWMLIPNKYRDDPDAADIVLLERRRGDPANARDLGDAELGRRTLLEEEVAASLSRIGRTAIWQPDEALGGLPGRPDFWLAAPRPINIAVRGCGPHAHNCDHPEAVAVSEGKRFFRTAHDARAVATWAALGVPTIVVWGCALYGPRAVERAVFDGLLAAALDRGDPVEISHDGLSTRDSDGRAIRLLTS